MEKTALRQAELELARAQLARARRKAEMNFNLGLSKKDIRISKVKRDAVKEGVPIGKIDGI